MNGIIQMFFLGFLIGLTGALAPGPTLIATINASLKGGWSMGPRVTLGHIAVEILMVILIIAGLSVILCVGETEKERDSGEAEAVVCRQLAGSLPQGEGAAEQLSVAYEPVWAIGTGKTATDAQADEAHAFIRALLREQFGPQVADDTRILYGGSVKPGNIDGLMAQPDVDGALVGGASLKADEFVRIVRYRHS